MSPKVVLGVSGSLRRASHNTSLLRTAQELAPADVDLRIYEGLAAIPPYDQDADTDRRRPHVVRRLRALIARADALLVATPEYNHSVPGVLKNAVDWVSTVSPEEGGHPLDGKIVAIIGSSAGAGGSARAQSHLRQILYSTACHVVVAPEVTIRMSYQQFDERGDLVDAVARDLLTETMVRLRDQIDVARSQLHWHEEPALPVASGRDHTRERSTG